jgi:membrane-anchored protein YejM (alkaline phosphatase superfamily)
MIRSLKQSIKKLIRYEPLSKKTRLPTTQPNLIMLTYDSCRYDTLCQASTPVLDSYSKIYEAYSPATYTYPAHLSFFCGILPHVADPIPYYNRFVKQLIAIRDIGDGITNDEHADYTFILNQRSQNIVSGLRNAGYYTVGSAGASWFSKRSLTFGFNDFHYKNHARGRDQIDLILGSIKAKNRKFFAFINFMETHTPYMHYEDATYHMTARTKMTWPPQPNEHERGYGKKLHQAQIQAAEYLDTCLPLLFDELPANTLVALFGDHGEAFGEDGYWGHGVHHTSVLKVPMCIFSLDKSIKL